ncbi:hypothetical protein LSH36_1478g00029, partial [Paralvinella palmiformis]
FATVYDQEPDEALLSHIQDELQILKELKEPADDAERYGHKSENINKNRNYELIPHNAHGLFLSRSKTGNYINAVSVDSFKAHDSYIVTQMPLPDTINDFWQLIIEQGCQAIVMLNDMSTEDKTCLRYWPKDEHTKEHYGQVEVELTSVNVEDFLIIRDLKVTEIAKVQFSQLQIITN